MMRILAPLLLAMLALPAQAKFHKFEIQEVFSNADGTVQFIEMLGDDDEQHEIANHSMATNGSSFEILTNLPTTRTDRRHVLFATESFAALPGAPTPDYIIPANFINISGDTINWAEGSDDLTYGALPTDGTTSLDRAGRSRTNSPTNFAGATGSIDASGAGSSVCGDGTLDADEACDDGNTFSGDCCSATCQFESSGSSCSDGNACTTADTCDGAGACAAGALLDCNDGNACTQDSCDPASGCQNPAQPPGTACEDGSLCTVSDTCDGAGACAAGPPLDCDDKDPSTADGCDAAGGCFHTPIQGFREPSAVPLSTPLTQGLTALVLATVGAGGLAHLRRRR